MSFLQIQTLLPNSKTIELLMVDEALAGGDPVGLFYPIITVDSRGIWHIIVGMNEAVRNFEADYRKKFGAHDAPYAAVENNAEPTPDDVCVVKGEGLKIVRELLQHDVNAKQARMSELAESYVPGVSARADAEFKKLKSDITRIEQELGPLLKKRPIH